MTSPFSADTALLALKAPRGKPAPPPPLEAAAFDAAHAAIATAIANPDGPAEVLDAVEKAWARADRLWDTIRATPAFALGTPPAACRRGCGWCCHQRVGAAAVEVMAIARRLPEPLKQRLDGWNAGKPCAFLVEGACAIYDSRPLKCRSLWHLDVRHCMGKYAGLPAVGATPNPGFQAEPKMIYEGALKGLALPLIKAGRSCPGIELMPGLKAALARPDAAEAWWRGEAVFPAACRLDWFPEPARRKR